MRNVREFVCREEILPDGVVADVGARIGRHGPEHDRRRVERRERVSVRGIDRIVDHDVDTIPRSESDEGYDLATDSLDALREGETPRAILGRVVKGEVLGLDCVPLEPGPRCGTLRVQREGREEEQGGEPGRAATDRKTKGRAPEARVP